MEIKQLSECENKIFKPNIAKAIAIDYVQNIMMLKPDNIANKDIRDSLIAVQKEFAVDDKALVKASKRTDNATLVLCTIAFAICLFVRSDEITTKSLLTYLPFFFLLGLLMIYIGRGVFILMGKLTSSILSRTGLISFITEFLQEHPANFFIGKDDDDDVYYFIFLPFTIVNHMLEQLSSEELNEKATDLLNLTRNLEVLSNYLVYIYFFSRDINEYLQNVNNSSKENV